MRPTTVKLLSVIALIVNTPLSGQTYELQNSLTKAEFRGLSAVSSEVVWASGRGGWFAVTTDGGRHWQADTIPGASNLFLVDVHGLSAQRAYVLGTDFNGGLGRVYQTSDGGETWTLQYEIVHPQAFLDGFTFFDERSAVAFGDPVDGSFFILRTTDGRNWSRVASDRIPPPLEGEAGFAASGTAIATDGDSTAWIGTGGGPFARVLVTTDRGATWAASRTPLAAGPTAGIFGVAFRNGSTGVAVGGDYSKPGESTANILVTRDGGATWKMAGSSLPAGVRYGAVFRGGLLIATGPSGIGFSRDMGTTWTAIDTVGFNTVDMLPDGTGWMAGVEGRMVRFRIGN